MAQGRPYQAYQKTCVKTANQKKLVIMLYDGLDRFLSQAILSIEKKDTELAHKQLSKASKILMELMATLREDAGGDVAKNLKTLYVYCYEKLVIANLKKDPEVIKQVQKILNNLREGWAASGQTTLKEKTQATSYGRVDLTG